MKKNLLIAIWFTLVTTVMFGVLYPLAITGLAQVLFPHQANGQLIEKNGKIVGSRIIGQSFTEPGYFHSRPSNAGTGYDPTSSSGSNLGPTNKILIDRVKGDVQKLQAENPTAPDPSRLGDGFWIRPGSRYLSCCRGIPNSSRCPFAWNEAGGCARPCVEAYPRPRPWVPWRAPCECLGTEFGPRFRK